ncbi:MAG TPA: hypothetical protein VKB39_04625, partial [Candidatus Baltobacteraceae bacterium]|nr:hypothetical protein [Candidatus Baltobacteraceae bacterium]
APPACKSFALKSNGRDFDAAPLAFGIADIPVAPFDDPLHALKTSAGTHAIATAAKTFCITLLFNSAEQVASERGVD